MNKRFNLSFLAVFLAAILLTTLPSTAGARQQPLVFAFYYAWFDQNIWDLTKVADLPTLKYLSNDPTTIARQIQMAQHAGIDVFVVSWWGAGNPTDVNFRSMLDVAAATNFKAAVDFEITSPFYKNREQVVNSLKHLMATHANHPGYLRVNGKPVIFFWSQKVNPFTLFYSVDEWKAIRDQVDPNRQALWIAEGIDWTYLRVFDGLHLYSIAWSPNVFGELAKWPRRVKSFGEDKIWVATVMPGNDDRKTRRPDSYVRDRANGNFYRDTWRAAFATSPDWIMITSWNEWVEGTQIEPSVTYGNLYLDITREFTAKFKAGLPAPTPTPSPTPRPTRTATRVPTIESNGATATPPQIALNLDSTASSVTPSGKTTDALRVRSEPDINATILGRYAPNVSIPLYARTDDGKWFQTQVPASDQRGWVAADFLSMNGSSDILPVLIDSALATPTPGVTPTENPASAPSSTSTPPEQFNAMPTATPTPAPTRSGWFPNIPFPFRLPIFP